MMMMTTMNSRSVGAGAPTAKPHPSPPFFWGWQGGDYDVMLAETEEAEAPLQSEHQALAAEEPQDSAAALEDEERERWVRALSSPAR